MISARRELLDHPALKTPHLVTRGYCETNLNFAVAWRFEAGDGVIYKPDDAGRLVLPVSLVGTWVLTITNHQQDIQRGALLSLLAVNSQFAHRFQTDRPDGRDYATLETDSAARLCLEPRGSLCLAHVVIKDGVWRVGETLTLRLGDRRESGYGSETFWATTDAEIRIAIDLDGDNVFHSLAGTPLKLSIRHRETVERIRVLGPTIAAVGQPFALHCVAFDCNFNVVENCGDTLTFDAAPHVEGLPGSIAFSPRRRGVAILEGLRITRPGIFRLTVREPGSGRSWRSNPIVVETSPSRQILWGDIHCHGWGEETMYMMHLRTAKVDPAQRHRQAHEVGRYDWAAPGPMALPETGHAEIWQAWRDAGRAAEVSGKYIPFLSYEAHPPEGDRQVVFREGWDEPTPGFCRMAMRELDQRYATRQDVLLEVHIGGSAPDWTHYAPQQEAMVEVASGFGNAEWLLQDALERGYHPAVVGGSDAHLGVLGAPRAIEPLRGRFGFRAGPMNQRDVGFGTGPIAAAITNVHDREAIWNAFRQRLTYATTGARIFVDACFNEEAIGTTIDPSGGVRMQLRCCGEEPIESVVLICGPWELRRWEYPSAASSLENRDVAIDEHFREADLPGDWLYLRIRQVDGEYAWTTPVWLKPRPTSAPHSLRRWNATALNGFDDHEEQAARTYMPALLDYLKRVECHERFTELTPRGILRESNGRAALFHGYWVDGGERYPIQIRWYATNGNGKGSAPKGEQMPRVRFDWGWSDIGPVHELERAKAIAAALTNG